MLMMATMALEENNDGVSTRHSTSRRVEQGSEAYPSLLAEVTAAELLRNRYQGCLRASS